MIGINCDLCGKITESLVKAIIESVHLDVCNDCAKFGKVIAQPKRLNAKGQIKQFHRQIQKEEKIELVVDNYADIIKRKREVMGLTQKDFANRLNEKEATIHKIETGAFLPLPLAKKLERILGVKLVEEYEEKHESSRKRKEEGFTLGDFINVKK